MCTIIISPFDILQENSNNNGIFKFVGGRDSDEGNGRDFKDVWTANNGMKALNITLL